MCGVSLYDSFDSAISLKRLGFLLIEIEKGQFICEIKCLIIKLNLTAINDVRGFGVTSVGFGV